MVKQFFSLMKRYIMPYRKYLTWALILNFLSQWLNVFSFMAIIPILNILFKIDTKVYEYMPMDWETLTKMFLLIMLIIGSVILFWNMALFLHLL